MPQEKRETLEQLVRSLKEELRNEEAKLDILKDLHRRSVNRAKEEALKAHASSNAAAAQGASHNKYQAMNGDAAPMALTVNRSSSNSSSNGGSGGGGAPFSRQHPTVYGHPTPAHSQQAHRRTMPNVPANLSITKAPAAHAASSAHGGHGAYQPPPITMPPGLYQKTTSGSALVTPKVGCFES
jgi:hypothetical protein